MERIATSARARVPLPPWTLARCAVSAAFLAGIAGAASGQGTIFVGGPRADFASLELAVGSAPSGSLLLVKPGSYGSGASGGFTIDGKSLAIAPSVVGGRIDFVGQITIRNLTAGQSVTLLGFDGQAIEFGSALFVQDVDGGVVWIEDCTFTGDTLGIFIDPTPARILDSSDVVVVRSSFTAIPQLGASFAGDAMFASGSSLHLFEVALTGAPGVVGATVDGTVGGIGLIADDGGFLYARGSTFQGGDGGDVGGLFGGDCENLTGGDGGVGLRLADAGTEAFLVDCDLFGGAGGQQQRGGTCPPGSAGAGSMVDPGAVLDSFPSVPHALTVSSPVSPIADVPLNVQAVEGEFAWYLLADEPGATFIPGKYATEVVGDHIVLPIGTVGPGGALQGTLPAVLGAGPGYPATFGGTVLYVQPFTYDTPASLALLGTPAAIVVRPLGGGDPFVEVRTQTGPR